MTLKYIYIYFLNILKQWHIKLWGIQNLYDKILGGQPKIKLFWFYIHYYYRFNCKNLGIVSAIF